MSAADDHVPPPGAPGTALVPWVPPPSEREHGEEQDPERDADDRLSEHLERAAAWQKAWELHQFNVPYRTIAQHLGVASIHTVHRYIRNHERTMAPSADVERWRNQQLAELALLRGEVLREAKTSSTSWIAATASILSIQKRQAELIGLDRTPPPDEFARMSDSELEALIAAGGRM